MARKSGLKNQGNKHGNGKSKPRGPSSDSQALKIRSLEEVLGVEEIDFGIENEVLTPKSSLQHLQIRSELRHSFNDYLQAIHNSNGIASRTQSRSNLDVGTIPILLDQTVDDYSDDDSINTVIDNDVVNNVESMDVNDVDPIIETESNNPVEIELEDIQEEVEFWMSAVVCYVVGANPPINVMEGFIRRIWKHLNVDKVVMVKRGVFIVRFLTMDSRDKVLDGHYFFDNKPLIMKPWNSDMDMDKEEVKSVPIWVQLKLGFKYWGERALFKIISQIGKPIKRDQATLNRDKLQFARVMVDVPLSKELPDCISFRDENGLMVNVGLYYEWRPTLFSKCKMIGHLQEECRQGKSKRVWVQKAKQVQPDATLHTVTSPVVDPEGFQRSIRPIRFRTSPREPVRTSNVFQILDTRLNGDVGVSGDDNIATWNVRGLNSLQKQNEVKHFIQKYEVGLVGLLEHKVKLPNLGKLYQKVFVKWCFTSNASYHPGGRIVVAWKAGSFNVNIVAVSSQFLHCHITPVSGMPAFFCTFIYAHNEAGLRQDLWRDLNLIHTAAPWILCGDFNCFMAPEERIGAPVKQCDIVDMYGCIHSCGMEDLKSVEVCFLPEGQFDHSPDLLTIGGSKMFTVVSKLERVKLALKKLNKNGFTDVQAADLKAPHELIEAQEAMHKDPTNLELADAELRAIQDYKDKHKIYLDIHYMGGVWKDNPTKVADAFLDYYKQLLGSNHESRTLVLKKVVQLGPVCQAHHKEILNANYTADEIRAALFSIPGAKAPGPDGFGSHFYKDSWHYIQDSLLYRLLDLTHHMLHSWDRSIPETAVSTLPNEVHCCCQGCIDNLLPEFCQSTMTCHSQKLE
ncbi:uncharacterized protein [Spinacia oleracea]|uniref:DUF4283 domain-containing protein n=1 Tax=Spinacia oleracea TaxID=3562 RepID=A0ABM3RJJ7_SPIOL|nr:uncharacterized protein LOC110779012 [Spinacia oleracea]